MLAGVSTLGITFGYGVETVAGTKPESFKQLHRINEIGEVTAESESIDASALEDVKTRRIRGRADTGDTLTVTVNWTPETYAEWKALVSEYDALTGGKRMWFETITPGFDEGDFVVAQPPTFLPSPSKGQNELLTVQIPLVIEEYVGMQTKTALTDLSA